MSKDKAAQKRRRKERLSEAQNHRCAYCGCDVWGRTTLDHIIPRRDGGNGHKSNLVIACQPCNERRKHSDAYEFFRKISEKKRK